MAANMNNKSEDKLEFDFGNDNKNSNDTKEKNINDDNYDDVDDVDLNLDDLDFDDLDLNFDEEEKADEEELNDIQQRKKDKMQDQFNPFDEENNSEEDNIKENNIDSDISNLDIQDNINIDDINESVMQIDDNTNDSKVQSDIIKMDEEIDNINLFMKHMEKKGYQFESSRFLTKKFAESSDMDTIYNINITINNEVITAITGYDSNNKIITVPNSIITTVKNDIQESLKQII